MVARWRNRRIRFGRLRSWRRGGCKSRADFKKTWKPALAAEGFDDLHEECADEIGRCSKTENLIALKSDDDRDN